MRRSDNDYISLAIDVLRNTLPASATAIEAALAGNPFDGTALAEGIDWLFSHHPASVIKIQRAIPAPRPSPRPVDPMPADETDISANALAILDAAYPPGARLLRRLIKLDVKAAKAASYRPVFLANSRVSAARKAYDSALDERRFDAVRAAWNELCEAREAARLALSTYKGIKE